MLASLVAVIINDRKNWLPVYLQYGGAGLVVLCFVALEVFLMRKYKRMRESGDLDLYVCAAPRGACVRSPSSACAPQGGLRAGHC